MPEATYYAVLGVSTTASLRKIKRAYRSLARQYHPDLHPGNADAEARFKVIATAAAVLTDPHQRVLYDAYLTSCPDSVAAVYEDEQRNGYDVQYTLMLSRAEAAQGAQRALGFHAPDGTPYQIIVEVPAGSRAGTCIRLRGQGGPALYGSGRGDFYAVIQIREELDARRTGDYLSGSE